MDDLMGDFIAEIREMLDAIAGELVAWEAAPGDRARLDAIFRFVHTVKGSCGYLDVPRLARLSHAAEDVLADLRAGRRRVDPALVSAVLGIVDRIGELAEAMGSGASLPDDEDQLRIAALQPDAGGELAPLSVAGGNPRMRSRTVRLPVELLDRVIRETADLVLARDELTRRLREAGHCALVATALDRLSASVDLVRDAVARSRMQRVDHLFAGIPRLVRDLSAELGRLVVLELDGGDVELDREMIEAIRDPITHILRNAIDHGIEPPHERRAAGKRDAGSLRISARRSGARIVIEAADDGRGIDCDRLAARAVEAGLMPAAQAACLSAEQKLALVFEPGISTAPAVTAISGRGVGMDVVRANVERIGGVVAVESRRGLGTRIIVRLPLRGDDAPLCLLGDSAEPWTREILAPLVAAAGYRVAFADDPGNEPPDIAILAEGSAAAGAAGAPVVRLRAQPEPRGEEDESVYRDDRSGLIAALRARSGQARR